MTTNDATAREHVAMTILFVDRAKPDELIAANWEARKDRNSGLESQEELLRYADNAIAAHSEYLWQAADDPEVLEAVEKAMYRPGRGKKHAYGVIERNGMDGSIERLLEDDIAANWFIAATLTALIGPRPGSERT